MLKNIFNSTKIVGEEKDKRAGREIGRRGKSAEFVEQVMTEVADEVDEHRPGVEPPAPIDPSEAVVVAPGNDGLGRQVVDLLEDGVVAARRSGVGWLVDFDDSNDNFYMNVLGQTPSNVRSANALADYWIDRVLNRPMAAADRTHVVQFMAQGVNPDFDLNWGDEDIRDRVRSMVALILMSPDFLWR